MNIKMPSHDEREQNICSILELAVPAKRTFLGEIKRLWRTVGIQYAFRGVGDATAAALMISATTLITVAFFVTTIGEAGGDVPVRFTPIMLLAPILYFSLLSFTAWKERMSGTWEVLSVCRYNLKYITAIRVIVVSAAGFAFVPLLALPLVGTGAYGDVLISAFCAMFLYGTLSLLSMLISESKITLFALPVLWTLLWGAALIRFTPTGVEQLLSDIPIAFTGGAAILSIAIYIVQLRLFIMRSTRSAVYIQQA
ncbi:hypothetical protein LQZ18_03100 [Lachnospiraceae bacterium ZAX-1]